MARKPTYEELERSVDELTHIEERFNLLINNMPVVIWQTDTEGNTNFISPNVEKIYGFTPEEIYKAGEKLFLSRIHPDDVDIVRDAIENFFKKGSTFELTYRIKHKNGHWIWLHDQAFKIYKLEGKEYAFGMFSDITERKKTEELLKQSEAKYQDLYDNAPDMFLSIDFETAAIIECNQTLLDTLGYTKEEIIHRSVFDLYAPESIEHARDRVFQSFIKKGIIKDEELRVRKKDGTIIDISLNASAVRDKDGRILHSRSIWRDITKSKMAEQELRKEKDKSQTYFNVANVMLVVLSANGKVSLVNQKGCEILGYDQTEIIGKDWFDEFVPKRLKKEVKSVFIKLMGGDIEPVGHFENPIITDTGEERIISWHNTILKDDQGKIIGTLSSGNDITPRKRIEEEKKRLEHQLIQTQKMEAIGALAGGIAHDFNNLLMGVLGNSSLMLSGIDASHPHYENLIEIENYVKNAVNLTKQLLGFARGGKYETAVTDINKLIKEHNRMFGRTKKEITIRSKYDPDLWAAEVDRSQINQVLMNIYVNAWQAMPDGGELFVLTENIKLDKNYNQPFKLKHKRHIKISITDTGIGIDKNAIGKIFDPFFTTKEKERGTGMGLSSAYGIIQNHGGFITVYSEPGHGSTFNIYLPASKKKPKKTEKAVEYTIHGSGTVLLVDDEDMILNVGKKILERLGYNVLLASGGKEGLKTYQKNSEDIDIVILDMIMPDLSGGETFEKLKSINPKVKVLLSSGYSLDGKAKKILDQGCNGFIQKPFNMNQLSQKISDILNT